MGIRAAPRFEGELCLTFQLDGRYVKVAEPFSFFDSRGNEWTAPAGLVCDGATIPRLAWPIIGGPFEGKHRRAAILHDAAYAANGRMKLASGVTFIYSRDDADSLLYEAMRADGVNWFTAQIIYRNVRAFGWLPWREDGEAKERNRSS